MKKLLFTTAMAAMAVVAVAPAASAARATQVPYEYVAGHYYPSPFAFPSGVSYGTGYYGAGSITGGPSGGLPGRS